MKKIIILMATYNGQKYIKQQIDSIITQTVKEWELWVSDDGSVDDTVQIILEYKKKYPRKIFLLEGPKLGSAKNFYSLLKIVPDSNFYFFSDQDDIWYPEKLEYALRWLESNKNNSILLYGAKTRIFKKKYSCSSKVFIKKPCFRNALVQNIFPGNTMAFSYGVKLLVDKLGDNISAPFHDWLLYQIVSGAGGELFIDDKIVLDYRQHEGNILGENKSLLSKIKRLKKIFKHEYVFWNNLNINELKKISENLTVESLEVLSRFESSKKCKFVISMFDLYKSGVFRQDRKENFLLYLLVCFGML